MPAMVSDSRPGDRLSALEQATDAGTRFLDLCLIFQRKRTGEELLRVGGRWDRLSREFTESDPSDLRGEIIRCNENQVDIVVHFRAWLEARLTGGPRKRLLLTGGKRRGGKSYIQVALVEATMIALPEAICWMVSPNIGKRDELERYFKAHCPHRWRTYKGLPEYRFTIANGSTLQSLTGDTADALKRGEADLIFYNEPQDCSVDVLTYGAPAIVDRGGLLLFAGNPARKRKGEWFTKLREAIVSGEYAAGEFFDVDAAHNPDIDQAARSDIGQLLRLADPKAAQADDEGLWLPVGDRAYPRFDRLRHLRAVPDVGDITAEFLRKKAGRAYGFLGGADFQFTPHMAGVALRVFGTLAAPLFWACDEFVVPKATEHDFLDEVDDRGFTPESLFWVGDASGQWQDGKHKPDNESFKVFRNRRWHIEPPRKKKTDRGTYSKNPEIDDRLKVVARLFGDDDHPARLFVDPDRCPKLAEALRECPLSVGKFNSLKPYGVYSHITDALGYALYWAEPQPKPLKLTTGTAPPLGATFPAMRPGAGSKW